MTQTAFITGASSGIGAAYARLLASQGYDLVITARRESRLQALADDLRAAYNVDVRCIPVDLSDRDAIQQVADAVAGEDDLAVLVNNAGFGTREKYAQADMDKHVGMVDVHVTATMYLTRAALPGMIDRGGGTIINVSSIAAYLGGTTYAASKAYLNVFSRGLQAELKGTGVKVQSLCPGHTYSEFHDREDYADFDRSQVPEMLWMSSEAVAAESWLRLREGRVVVVTGWPNRILVALTLLGVRPLVKGFLSWMKRRR